MKPSIHKTIAYDMMEYLNNIFLDSELEDINENGYYQRLGLSHGFSIRFTQWRNGIMPFYIILFNKNDYIFELDLSMLVYNNDIYQWYLKPPRNKTTLDVLSNKLGGLIKFPDAYINTVRIQKKEMQSGVQIPKHGFFLLQNATWSTLIEKLSNLIIEVFNAHGLYDLRVNPAAIKEAENDNDYKSLLSRARRGQRALRLKLLELYDAACAVTGTGPAEVLEAAHILSHAISGINHSENALLLRADIHILFDRNLLKINPDTFEIVIHNSLKGTEYWKLDGGILRTRNDQSIPSVEYLKMKWGGTGPIKE